MGIIQAYKMAIKSILSNKVRAFLTMLGVIIGVGAVIAAVSFALGSTKNITDQIESMGTNLIQVMIRGRNSNIAVKYEDIQKFAEDNSDIIAAVTPQMSGDITVKFGSKSRETSYIGTDEAFEIIKDVHVQEGRFLLSFDSSFRQKVALVGTAVANDIFSGTDPVGQKMKINGEVFKVVGILQQTESGAEGSADDRIIIPATVAQRLGRSTAINNIAVQAASPDDVNTVMDKLNTFLLDKFKDSRYFSVNSQEAMLSKLGNITGVLMAVLGGIATISLIVGGIGIMNIMLVSVTERTREIGIRKAIGAKKRSILTQFLIEAIMVTGIGGLLGILLGLAIIRFVIGNLSRFTSNLNIPEVYSVPWMVMAFGISLAVGVIFGMFPAYKASKLNPIEALRFE